MMSRLLLIAALLMLTTCASTTPLMVAINAGDQQRALGLLQTRDVKATDGDGFTALHLAAQRDMLDLAKKLLDAGADPNAMSDTNRSPLHLASKSASPAMLDLLISRGADPNAKCCVGTGGKALHLAAWGNNIKTVEYWLKKGVPLAIADSRGQQPLHWAAMGGAVDTTRLLLQKGANPNARGVSRRMRPLHLAAHHNKPEVVKLLLDAGADRDAIQQMWNNSTAQDIAEVSDAHDALEVLRSYRPKPLAMAPAATASVTTLAATPAAPADLPPVPVAAAHPGEKRTALVIGNGRYTASPLSNPPSDAKLISGTLRQTGFDVTLVVDADQHTMKRSIEAFGDRLRQGGVGLFYFAGHGVQVKGRNYLIPIGAKIRSEGEVDIEAVDVARVLTKMDSAKNRLNLVILDACRNNPFARSYRSAHRGLAFVQAPQGTLISYATAPGDVADDGAAGNSPYTLALARRIRSPGIAVEQMFKAVRVDVQHATSGRQTPWESSSLTGHFSFVRKKGATTSTPNASVPAKGRPVVKP